MTAFRIIDTAQECEGRLTRMLFELWDELRGDRQAPLPSDFDYLARPKLISSLIVLKAPAGSTDLEAKFTGSAMQRLIGRDTTNEHVNESLERNRRDPDRAQFAKNTQDLFDLCLRECQPVLNGPTRLSIVARSFVRFESLTVPFVDEAGNSTQLASVVDIADLEDEK